MRKGSKKGSRNPADVSMTLDRVAELVPKLVRESFEAHAYGFERKDRRHFEENQEAKSPDRIADPTGEVAVEQEYTRRTVQEAFREIDEAEQLLQNAYSRLGRVFVTPDYEPLREGLKAGDRAPQNVKRDLQERERYLSSALSDTRRMLKGSL